jgi:hypothetical protein
MQLLNGLQIIDGMQIITTPPPLLPVLDLDAANYAAVPTNGSTIVGTGAYAITVANPGNNISWNSVNGGVFRVTAASSTDFFAFGPNYSGGAQAYTVGMAYKWNGTTPGRLLNANSDSPDFLMGLWGSGTARMNIAFTEGFIGPTDTVADTNWHFIWFTSTGTTDAEKSKSYVATGTAPSTTNGTDNFNSGFNGLRLFGRYNTSTTTSEEVDADVGFIKVWDKELSLAQIQAEHSKYRARFGY